MAEHLKRLKTWISEQKQNGDRFFKQQNYKMAEKYYSRELLKLKSINNEAQNIILDEIIILRNIRAECKQKRNQFHKALTDLNWIICASITERGSRINWKMDLFPHITKAIIQRAEIFATIGNTGQSLADYGYLLVLYESSNQTTPEFIGKRMKELSSLRHPSPLSMIKQNKYTLKLNKQSVTGWKKLKCIKKTETLPFKHGHSMITYKNKIYCFGGSNVQYGSQMFNLQTISTNIILFWEISIKYEMIGSIKNYYYYWKKLKFDDRFKNKIFSKNDDVTNWSKMITVNKWNDNKMIVFGGNNKPFSSILIFDFVTLKWNILNTKQRKFKAPKQIANHCSVIVDNKLYAYGGEESNMLFCLDLFQKIWIKLTGNNMKNGIDDISIPEQRFDHFMWTDKKRGSLGSLYVGYGSFFRSEFVIQCCRRNIWRYDIAMKKWNLESLNGNFPAFRTETGFTSTDNGVIIFGGYNPTLYSIYDSNQAAQFVYFGDCFEFTNKTKKWKQIHSKIYPHHRALCGVCIVDDFIVVYGGYHGGTLDTGRLFNDLWILDMKQCKTRNIKLKSCRNCSKSAKKRKLYICTRCCSVRYCSKRCQKLDWLRHKTKCFQCQLY